MTLRSKLLFILTFTFASGLLYAQNSSVISTEKAYGLSELRSTAETISDKKEIGGMGAKIELAGSKSPGLALVYSLLLPGAGHWYLDRMDVGKYFVGVEAASWTGLIALNIHGDNVAKDAHSYSVEHAQVTNPDGRDDDFYGNVGNFNSVYDYNNDKLTRGEYNLLYDVNANFWNWDSESNRDVFDVQRRDSERIYNNRIIFGSFLIANRIVSGISAYIIAKNMNSKKSYSLTPEIYSKKDKSFDGLGLNFVTNF